MNNTHEPKVDTNEIDSGDQFLGRSELAQRLGIHERTVSRMVERGELPQPCIGQGGRPRWLWSFVVEFCRKRHERMARRNDRLKS